MSQYIDNMIIEGTLDTNAFRIQKTSTNTSASTLSLTINSDYTQEFTGSVSGQIVQLPSATTLLQGHRFEFWNSSTTSITIKDGGGNFLLTLASMQTALFINDTNSTTSGTWLFSYGDYTPIENVASNSTNFDDFVTGTSSGISTLGTLRWDIYQSGTGNVTAPSPNIDNAHVGVVNLSTGSVSDICSLALCTILLGGGQIIIEGLVRIGTLGTSSQNYVIQFGLGTNYSNTSDPTDGIYFQYSQAASTLWQAKAVASSTVTTVNSSVTVAANSYYKLKIIINSAGTLATFYISPAGGGLTTLLGSSSTNIPSSSTSIQPFFKIRKTVGSTARSFDVDYFTLQVNLTNLR